MRRNQSATSLELVPTPTPAEFRAPRGPIVNAAWVIRHFHTDPDTSEKLVTEKWVRETIPGKVRVSYNVVGWFRDDVIAHYEKLRRDANA